MTALFVVTTLLAAALLVAVVMRRRTRRASAGVAGTPQDLDPVWVAGFALPARLHYQRGHSWVRVVGPDRVDVGIDEFAARLLGGAARIDLPELGSRVTQGATSVQIRTGPGRSARIAVPVTGEVVAVNRRLAAEPWLATREPYGEGRLFRVRCDGLAKDLRNLMTGRIAEAWTEESRDELEEAIDSEQAWACRDGGELTAGFGARLPRATWRRLVARFLLA